MDFLIYNSCKKLSNKNRKKRKSPNIENIEPNDMYGKGITEDNGIYPEKNGSDNDAFTLKI